MMIPFVIDNQQQQLGDILCELLSATQGKPADFATAYFTVSGYRLVKDALHGVGAFRLLIGSEPQTGLDVGLKPDAAAIKAQLRGDLEAEPFSMYN
ncbi:MAG: hypothetical protein IH899_08190 [Planctomycetes bacterium]|nr:hypothetical protein [Planctomycetota bacterium]